MPAAPQEPSAHRLSIVIPVYAGTELLNRLIASLRKTIASARQQDYIEEIIIINDNPGDEAIEGLLADEEKRNALPLKIIRNLQNLGFVCSVNTGLEHSRKHCDVLILNSDTVLFDGWLDGFYRAVCELTARDAQWGTLTPASNNAELATVPVMCCNYKSYENQNSAERMATLCGRLFSTSDALEFPVGIGFCMLMRRAALERIGVFSEEFSPGYGEEVDWCMRAAREGFKHFFIPSVFVHHEGGESFKGRKAQLVERAGKIINERYKGFDALIEQVIFDPHSNCYHNLIKPYAYFLNSVRHKALAVRCLPHHPLVNSDDNGELNGSNDDFEERHGISRAAIYPDPENSYLLALHVDGATCGSFGMEALLSLFELCIDLGYIEISSFNLPHSVDRDPIDLRRLVDFFTAYSLQPQTVAHA